MNYQWHDLLGNIGVVLILLSYLALQLGRLDARSVLYSAANAIGAALVIVSLVFEFNLSAFVIEVFWLAISIVGLLRQWRLKQA